MKLTKQPKETINNADLKAKVLSDVSSIEDKKLLKEISEFLELKKQMKAMEKEY